MDTLANLFPDPRFPIIRKTMEMGDLTTRKHLVMLARHQGLPRNGGNMFEITLPTIRLLDRALQTLSPTLGYPTRIHYLSGWFEGEAAIFLDEMFSDPVMAGAIIMAAFIYNPGEEELEAIKLASYMKEINVMNTTGVTHDIDFSCFFGNYNSPLHVDIPANPRMARHVHLAIDRWISSLQDISRPLTPHLSSKLLPTHTRKEMDQLVSLLLQDPEVATPASLEWLSFRHNLYVKGPAELKQRWYCNGVSPRSYFVAGATNYHDSKYTRNMWNSLVDSLEATNRFTRVDVRRIHIEDVKHALFYDLTSFTSNMALQPVFLEQLALYCTGKNIAIMDSNFGPLLHDLGSLIKQYNDTNHFPEYICPAFPSMLPNRHGVAGFLGVYGNIATCTFLHGAILLQLSHRLDGCGCAGDDAVIVVGEGEDERVYCCVRLLGILAMEKTFSTEFPDVIYLKRRTWIDFRSDTLTQSSFLQFPSMFAFLDPKDLGRFREAGLTKAERIRLTIKSLYTTFLSASRLGIHRQSAHSLIADIYERLHLPINGHVPQCVMRLSKRKPPVYGNCFVPSLDTFGASNFVEQTIRNCYKGQVALPFREGCFKKSITLQPRLLFKAQSEEVLSFCVKMGWVEKVEKQKELYIGDFGLELLLKEYNKFEKKERDYSFYYVTDSYPEDFRGGDVSVMGVPVYDYRPVERSLELSKVFESVETDTWDDDGDVMETDIRDDIYEYEEGEID